MIKPPFYHVKLYVHKVRLGRQARRWLRGNGAERTAAYCMWYLNRYARGYNAHKRLIYRFKRELVRIFYETGLCTQTTLQVQRLECWECDGTDINCWKCWGTGTYREHYLYRFVFEVDGRRYVWHQPKDLVRFPVQVDMAIVKEYQSGGRYLHLEKNQLELYMMAVWEYLRAHGVTNKEDVGFEFPSLTYAILIDIWGYKQRRMWRWRVDRVRTAWNNVRRLWSLKYIRRRIARSRTPASVSFGGASNNVATSSSDRYRSRIVKTGEMSVVLEEDEIPF